MVLHLGYGGSVSVEPSQLFLGDFQILLRDPFGKGIGLNTTPEELIEVRNALNHILTDHDAKSQSAYAETRRAIQPVDQDYQQHESGELQLDTINPHGSNVFVQAQIHPHPDEPAGSDTRELFFWRINPDESVKEGFTRFGIQGYVAVDFPGVIQYVR